MYVNCHVKEKHYCRSNGLIHVLESIARDDFARMDNDRSTLTLAPRDNTIFAKGVLNKDRFTCFFS